MFKAIAFISAAIGGGILFGYNVNWLGMVLVTGLVCIAVVLRLRKTPKTYGVTSLFAGLAAVPAPLFALIFLLSAWTTGVIVSLGQSVSVGQPLTRLLVR